MSKVFADYAHEKLLDLYHNHDHEVGSELYKEDPDLYADKVKTNCITYVMNCISYGFKKMGDDVSAKEVWRHIIRGTDLAAYLVHYHDWQGVYLNPDVRHPRDGNDEHPFSYYLAKKHCAYYGIPVSFFAVNYKPSLYVGGDATDQNTTDLAILSDLVKFGFGVSRGGVHTWLFSEGSVYEVHWASIGDDLYERSPMADFDWLSNVIVVPPEAAKRLRQSNIRRCG